MSAKATAIRAIPQRTLRSAALGATNASHCRTPLTAGRGSDRRRARRTKTSLHCIMGFMPVRYFGFFANRCRAQRLAQIRTALDAPASAVAEEPEAAAASDGCPCSPAVRDA